MNEEKDIIYSSPIFSFTFFVSLPGILASNHTDTAWNFNFTVFDKVEYTTARAKQDDTSAYMILTSRSKAQRFTASVVDSSYKNFTKTWYQDIVNVNQDYFVPNYAYEDRGYDVKVRIKATTGDFTGFDANGLWSPDSI